MKKKVLFSMAAAVIAFALSAVVFTACDFLLPEPSVYTISGTITADDPAGPLSGAMVTLKDITSTKGSATTGSNGTYTISDVADGTYTIEVTKDGYVKDEIPLVVVVGSNISGKDLQLSKNRLQATKGGTGISVYISQIVKSGNYVTIYLSSAAKGKNDTYLGALYNWGAYELSVTLQDLNSPARYWNPVNSGSTPTEDKEKGAAYLTFENVTGDSFSLTNSLESPHSVFSKIDLNIAGSTAFPAGETWFWPRPRATQAATNVDQYVVMAKKSGTSTTFYLSTAPFGRDDTYQGSLYNWGGYHTANKLKSLSADTEWTATNAGQTGSGEKQKGSAYVTFESVTGTSFSLTNTQSDPDTVFASITLP